MQRKTIFESTLAAFIILGLSALATSAQTVVLTQVGRGWYAASTGFHLNTNDNYLVGDNRNPGCSPVAGSCQNEYRNFFVFDLSAINQRVSSAILELSVPPGLGYDSGDPSENYELHDVVTSISALIAGTGGVAAFNDLGNGVVYGNRNMTAADRGTLVQINLNSEAVAAINSTNGLFGIGGSITTLDSVANLEFVFGATQSGLGTYYPTPGPAATKWLFR